MKTVQEINKKKKPIISVDPALEQYKQKILFPAKLKKANEMLEGAKLPKRKLQG